MLLKAASSRIISKVCGAFMDSPLSKPLIKGFISRNHILLSDYYADDFSCFNDCFTRRIREEKRPIASEPDALISPCDGLLSAYAISDGIALPIKQSEYTVKDLLGGNPAAERYRDGLCLAFRLCVDNYHRYCYIADVNKGENVFLPGRLHTVRPIALAELPVFTQNCREYTVMETARFGMVTQVEVGAMLVGKIKNHHGAGSFPRGQEKGLFLYGGSTIVLLLEKDRVELDEKFCHDTARGAETPVRMGERIGRASDAL